MLEMAVALPIFLLLVFGVFTIGSIYNHQMGLNTAAREAARLYAVGYKDADVQTAIRRLTPNLDHSSDRFDVVLSRDSTVAACQIRYVEKVPVPFLGMLFNNKTLWARGEEHFETEWIER